MNDRRIIHTGCYSRTAFTVICEATSQLSSGSHRRVLNFGQVDRDDSGEVVFTRNSYDQFMPRESAAVRADLIACCEKYAATFRKYSKMIKEFLLPSEAQRSAEDESCRYLEKANLASLIVDFMNGADALFLAKKYGESCVKDVVGTPRDVFTVESIKVLRNQLKSIISHCRGPQKNNVDLAQMKLKFDEIASKICVLREESPSCAYRFESAVNFGILD